MPSTIPGEPAAPSTGGLGPGNGQRRLARTADLASPSSPPARPPGTQGPLQSSGMRLTHTKRPPATCQRPCAPPRTPTPREGPHRTRERPPPPALLLLPPLPLPPCALPCPPSHSHLCPRPRRVGPKGDGPRRGRHFSGLLCCSYSFLSVLCATACRGTSLMQEPSGLLAPFLRVSLPLFVGRVRRVAPPRGLWLRHAQGAQPRSPAPLPSLHLTLPLTYKTTQHAASWRLESGT